MKTVIYTAVVLFMNFNFYSQQQDLFDTKWYATEMVVNGNTIPIPVLSSNQPEGCFVGIEIYSGVSNDAFIDVALCGACHVDVSFNGDATFTSWGVACLLCMDCGPCDPDGTATICTQGYLYDFEYNHNYFYDAYSDIFTYTITPLPNNHFELKIDKPNGDYVIYGTESTLSMMENETLTFSIVPNPASNTLALTGLKSEVGSAVIYTLNGNKISLVSGTTTYDISHLATGLYFISVTTVDGQKAVKKFIKN